jgi:putative glutamine amidotransferase
VEVVVGGEAPEQILARVDGLMLTGRRRRRSAAVWEDAARNVSRPLKPPRCHSRSPSLAAAIAKGIPLLAICRWHAGPNVAMGGTLVQDIPSQVTGALHHSGAAAPRRQRARSLGVEGSKGCRNCSRNTWRTMRPAM